MPDTPPSTLGPSVALRDSTRAWQAAAVVLAVFCATVLVLMVSAKIRLPPADLIGTNDLIRLELKLKSAPSDESLKQKIRAVDLRLRQTFFWRQRILSTGPWLLIPGAILFSLALRRGRKPLQSVPDLTQRVDFSKHRSDRERRQRLALLGAGAAVAGAASILAFHSSSRLAPLTASSLGARDSGGRIASSALGTNAPSAAAPFNRAQFDANWPQFRGPHANGSSAATNLPARWSLADGAGVLWKQPTPAAGNSSPVIWGDRIFLTGGDETAREVFCFRLADGSLLWRKSVALSDPAAAHWKAPELAGVASPTVACDGRRVFAIFATGELAALTFDGQLDWAKDFGVPKNSYGHGSSLAVWQDRLIVQLDQGEPQQMISQIYALDSATGQVLWKRARPVPSSWSTPIIFEAAGKTQVLALGAPAAIAYQFSSGAEIWRVNGFDGEITPSPIFSAGLAVAVSPSEKLFAIRADGEGDVSETRVAWSAEENVPDIASPAADGSLLFALTSAGTLACYDLAAGKPCWQHDFEMNFQASPSIADGRVYLFSSDGDGIVLQASRTFQQVSRNPLGEKITASPAFVSGRMIVRGVRHLFAL